MSVRESLAGRIIGQPDALDAIVPYIEVWKGEMAPDGRPAGVFLLLGPTGTGKTKTVEALAQVLHGSAKELLRVDCGEYQMDHEVAKLIGAPPGYLGFAQSPPVLSKTMLQMIRSEGCGLALVLFDEIEKAADSLQRILLGIMDKGTLRLGDGGIVDFQHTAIFLTSNVGSGELSADLHPFGLAPSAGVNGSISKRILDKTFSPEFINRVDCIITYRRLSRQDYDEILALELAEIQRLIDDRRGPDAFRIALDASAREWILDRGVSAEYGARNLKRVLHRHILHPLALQADGIQPGGEVRIVVFGDGLRFHYGARVAAA